MFQVIKRDGQIAEFDLTKISRHVAKAFEATQKQYNKDMIDLLSLRVTSDFQDKIKNNQIDVESIPGQRGEHPGAGRIRRCGQSLHPLSKAERKDPQYEIHDP